eukprot:CAMPEP_0198256342 /NCGR_PEP_ID=MMETSP1447-20131203/6282_1 /TAXON_ID=420782 /ORGANISM="Chaetoceros dichaeta, Strain CCMP1751" /LENGTH=175 /DNA_ID=CAMNT_0043942971 /DNA_START=162 /DNA_END=689 /DNA_ORIENTATION=-
MKRWGSAITTDTGLQIEDVEVGKGSIPGPKDFVSVHYDGFLPNGKVFDSSQPKDPKDDKRSSMQQGKPLQFQMGRGSVIAGWEEGVVGMRVGGKRKLVIPADLAYGQDGTPDGKIKPGQTLKFDVELVSIDGNMSMTGALGNSFLIALGIIATNGIFLAITGHELREYLNAAING